MRENEVDVMEHLLDVETRASAIVEDAQTESQKKIASAKSKADDDFNSKCSGIEKDLESDCNNKIKSADEEHSTLIQNFQNQITKSEKDTLSFNSFMDKVLFK